MHAEIETTVVRLGTHTEQPYFRVPCDDFRFPRESSEHLGYSSDIENVSRSHLPIEKDVGVLQTFCDCLPEFVVLCERIYHVVQHESIMLHATDMQYLRIDFSGRHLPSSPSGLKFQDTSAHSATCPVVSLVIFRRGVKPTFLGGVIVSCLYSHVCP